jgi:hypothetical protein
MIVSPWILITHMLTVRNTDTDRNGGAYVGCTDCLNSRSPKEPIYIEEKAGKREPSKVERAWLL